MWALSAAEPNPLAESQNPAEGYLDLISTRTNLLQERKTNEEYCQKEQGSASDTFLTTWGTYKQLRAQSSCLSACGSQLTSLLVFAGITHLVIHHWLAVQLCCKPNQYNHEVLTTAHTLVCTVYKSCKGLVPTVFLAPFCKAQEPSETPKLSGLLACLSQLIPPDHSRFNPSITRIDMGVTGSQLQRLKPFLWNLAFCILKVASQWRF